MIFIPLLSENVIFPPTATPHFLKLLLCPFALILPYFAIILPVPFYFSFFRDLFPFYRDLFPFYRDLITFFAIFSLFSFSFPLSSFFSSIVPLFLFPIHIFPPNNIGGYFPHPRGGGVFSNIYIYTTVSLHPATEKLQPLIIPSTGDSPLVVYTASGKFSAVTKTSSTELSARIISQTCNNLKKWK